MAETRSIEQLLADIDKEVAALPPGSDLAGFISKRHREIGELLARRVVDQRLAASPEAASPPLRCVRNAAIWRCAEWRGHAQEGSSFARVSCDLSASCMSVHAAAIVWR